MTIWEIIGIAVAWFTFLIVTGEAAAFWFKRRSKRRLDELLHEEDEKPLDE
jgi:prolipoprotein diacylglyceryltransferase